MYRVKSKSKYDQKAVLILAIISILGVFLFGCISQVYALSNVSIEDRKKIVDLDSEFRHVVDEADLIDTDDESVLEKRMTDIMEANGIETVIVTVTDTQSLTEEEFADDFFDYNGYGVDTDDEGILLLINMGSRKIHISTKGKHTISAYDSMISDMVSDITSYLGDGDYLAGMNVFLDKIEARESRGTLKGYGIRLVKMATSFIPYVLALVLSLIVTIVITVSSKGKITINERTYESVEGFHLTDKRDEYLREIVTKRKIPKNNTSSGGGSHTSSSGSSHGGGGGSF